MSATQFRRQAPDSGAWFDSYASIDNDAGMLSVSALRSLHKPLRLQASSGCASSTIALSVDQARALIVELQAALAAMEEEQGHANQ